MYVCGIVNDNGFTHVHTHTHTRTHLLRFDNIWAKVARFWFSSALVQDRQGSVLPLDLGQVVLNSLFSAKESANGNRM